MAWEVELVGDSFDLDQLAEAMSNCEPSIIKANCRYVLKSQKFENYNSEDEVRNLAEGQLTHLNGICRLLLSTHQPLKIGAITKILPNGSRHTSVSIKDTMILRDAIGAIIKYTDGSTEIINQADPAIQWLDLASRDEQVSKVFRLSGSAPFDWVNMYRIFEIIKQDMGGIDNINKFGWATLKSMKLFSHTANHPLVAGDLARHGFNKEEPPSKPMALAEAKAILKTLIENWIRYKCEKIIRAEAIL